MSFRLDTRTHPLHTPYNVNDSYSGMCRPLRYHHHFNLSQAHLRILRIRRFLAIMLSLNPKTLFTTCKGAKCITVDSSWSLARYLLADRFKSFFSGLYTLSGSFPIRITLLASLNKLPGVTGIIYLWHHSTLVRL